MDWCEEDEDDDELGSGGYECFEEFEVKLEEEGGGGGGSGGGGGGSSLPLIVAFIEKIKREISQFFQL